MKTKPGWSLCAAAGLRRALACAAVACAWLSSAPAFAQQANLVGFWYKPSESGWGVSIQQQGTRTFAVWFTYDSGNAPIWYTLDCAFAGNVCSGNLFTATGTPLAQIIGPANSTAVNAGTGSL
ncbi:MAG TPA: hypothetical protein VFV17_09280, partial [Usitatibacteraceae bacterium]|nr:hypothetical protein [Usitatibacteraceae bacterium]